jgi:hypothetical protein
MVAPSFGPTTALLGDGRVLALDAAAAQLYDPVTGHWHSAAAMPGARSGFAATVLLDGRVLVAGGNAADGQGHSMPVPATALYSPASDTWQDAGTLVVPRAGHAATRLQDGRVLVTGGGVARTEVYDPKANAWHASGERATNGEDHGCLPRPRTSPTPAIAPA